MKTKTDDLRDAFLACDADADINAYNTENGEQYDVVGTLPTNVFAGADNEKRVSFTSWLLGRGRWLCLESGVLYNPTQAGTAGRLVAMAQAVQHANSTGEWVTQFVPTGQGVMARMTTMLSSHAPMEETVRPLIEDFVQAIDACHLFFSIASENGSCIPRLLDDPAYVVWLLRWGLSHESDQGLDDEEEDDGIDEEGDEDDDEQEINLDDDEDEDDEPDDDEAEPGGNTSGFGGSDGTSPSRPSRRPPWE